MPLDDTFIRSVKPLDKPKKYFDGGGLFLFVPASGSKLWRMAYRFDGKSKLLSFGEYPAVPLKDARERREEAKKLLARNIDPSEQKELSIAMAIIVLIMFFVDLTMALFAKFHVNGSWKLIPSLFT